MSGHVYNGTTWERVKTMHVWNGTVFEQVKEAWRWTGSGWEKLYAVPVAIFDDFNRANTTGDIGPLWTKVGTNSQITSNTYATSGTTDGSRGIVTIGQINNDDGYVEAVMATVNNTSDTSIMCRCNSDATQGLSVNIFGDEIYLARFAHASGLTAGNSGQGMTDIGANSGGSVPAGATVRCDFVGDHYVVKVNGATVIDVTDASVPRGVGYRHGAIRVERNPFQNSGAVNSFKLADIGA